MDRTEQLSGPASAPMTPPVAAPMGAPSAAPVASGVPGGDDLRRGRRAAVLVGLALWALLACWATATGRYGGPDEPAHVLRAHAVAHGDLLGEPVPSLPPGYRAVTVPASLGTGDPACYRHDPTATSECAEPVAGGDVRVATSAGSNPPLYYALVGLPTRAVGASGDPLAHRLVAAALVAVVVALLVRRSRWPAPVAALVVATVTPSCWFLWGVVNPNALEVALVALAAGGIVRGRAAPSTADAWWVGAALGLAIAMRPLAAVWAAALLVICELEWRRRPDERARVSRADRLRVRLALWGLPALGVATVAAWSWWSALVVDDVRTAGTGSRADALWASIGGLPRTGAELVASLGWREFWAPWPAVAAWAAGVVLLARTRPGLRAAGWAVCATALVVVPVAFEVVLYEQVGLIWQGRYLVPVAAAATVLAAGSLRRPPSPRAAVAAVVAGGAGVVVTFWSVARRAAVGTDGSWFFTGAAPTSRGFSPGTWVVVHTVMVVACCALLVQAIRTPGRGRWGAGRQTT
jgi:hypothetical protein